MWRAVNWYTLCLCMYTITDMFGGRVVGLVIDAASCVLVPLGKGAEAQADLSFALPLL